jgi:hypothetical protein
MKSEPRALTDDANAPVNSPAMANRLVSQPWQTQGEPIFARVFGSFGAATPALARSDSCVVRAVPRYDMFYHSLCSRARDRLGYVITLARLRVLDWVCGPEPLQNLLRLRHRPARVPLRALARERVRFGLIALARCTTVPVLVGTARPNKAAICLRRKRKRRALARTTGKLVAHRA